MPGSKCQIVVLAGKTGHFTDIIKNKKRGGKTNEQDTKDKPSVSGNGHLDSAFWYFCRLYTICPFNGRNTVDAFKSDFIFDSGNRFYGC